MYQMAPLSWVYLMFMFCLLFMFFNTLNFYCLMNIKPTNNPNKKLLTNWKW